MVRADQIALSGTATELLANATFRVKRDNDQEVLAQGSGKMRNCRVRGPAGDRVGAQMTPYDLTEGRLTFLLK